jgi:RecA-family ATPase
MSKALGTELRYGEVSILAAPSGNMKTTLAVGWACELASGKSILGDTVHSGPQRVLFVSQEDPEHELRRRFLGTLRGHKLSQADADNIQFIGWDGLPDDPPLFLVSGTEDAPAIDQSGFTMLRELIEESEARVVIISLLALFVPIGLNNNTLMAQVVHEPKQIAVEFNLAILVIHHTYKDGVGAVVDHARRVNILKEATKGVPTEERGRYFRLVSGKNNSAPTRRWYEIKRLNLNNATPTYPEGDEVFYATMANNPAG